MLIWCFTAYQHFAGKYFQIVIIVEGDNNDSLIKVLLGRRTRGWFILCQRVVDGNWI